MSFALYLGITYISVVFSVDISKSFNGWLIMLGYSLIAFTVPLLLIGYESVIRFYVFFVAVVAAAVVLTLYYFYGYGEVGRFALGEKALPKGEAASLGYATVDPNMTAAGLYLALLIYLPNVLIRRKSIKVKLVEISGLILIFSAGLITSSRSALVGLLGAILLSSLMVFLKNVFYLRINYEFILRVIAFVFLFLLMLIFSYTILPDRWESIYKKLLNSPLDESRLRIIGEAISVYTSGVKEMIIGSGYLTNNPHNEFLRAAASTGTLGLISLIMFCLLLCFHVFKAVAEKPTLFFSATSIIFYIFIITLFYGYSKLLWIAVMFLLILYWQGCRLNIEKSYFSRL